MDSSITKIRCVQTGNSNGPITQGLLVREWDVPTRRPPNYDFAIEERGSVALEGHDKAVGKLIPSKRTP